MQKRITSMKTQWEKWSKPLEESEITRLDKTFSTHLRKMGVKYTKSERITKIKEILKIQNYTCAFGDGDGSYCWNHIRNKKLSYLKLEWGHKIPVINGKKAQKENNLMLVCARCNNQIQTSQTIEDLIPELEHKLKALKKLNCK